MQAPAHLHTESPSPLLQCSAPEEEQEGWDLDAELPSYEFRFECAKLLLELDDSTEDAIEVLESLVAEDDMDPNAWHMLGLAYYSGGHLAEAEEALERGEALLGKLGVPADHELRGHYEDLKDAVQDAKAKMGEGAGAEGGDGEVMEE